MTRQLPIADCRPAVRAHRRGRLPIERQMAVLSSDSIVNRLPRRSEAKAGKSKIVNGFTLVEMLVVLVLLSLIVLALMAVFNSTQKAFRASLTQTDYLGSGRLVMEQVASDLEKMTPSFGATSVMPKGIVGFPLYSVRSPVNFYTDANRYNPTNQPFPQYLPGASTQRTNVLGSFFCLSRQNVNGSPSWVGTGYLVDPLSFPTNSLYRFMMITNGMNGDPFMLFSRFAGDVSLAQTLGGRNLYNPFTNTVNWTHIMDGVVDLRVRPYDPDGFRMTNEVDFYNKQYITNENTYFFQPPDFPPSLEVYGCLMFSNTVPASVEVEMGVVENTTLQHAEGLSAAAAVNYLSNHVGQVHIFRQRVQIPGVDRTAYQ